MYCLTKLLQTNIKIIFDLLESIKQESADIYKAYWSSDANTTVGALGDSDPATYASRLIKTEYSSGLALVEDLDDFFTNSAVTQTDYKQTCGNLFYGSATTPTLRTNATEAIGDRLKNIASSCLAADKLCVEALKLHTESEIYDAFTNNGNFSAGNIVFGSEMTKADLNAGITLIEQFKKMMNNEAVTTADYAVTLATWKRF